MLVQFQVENFRSISTPISLSLVASAAKEFRESHTFDPKVSGFARLVRSAVLYGPNASGKTNLLLALQFVQNLVINSATMFQQGTPIPYTPFKFSPRSQRAPGHFEVTFVQDRVLYEYRLVVDAVRVYEERLTAYPLGRPQRLFDRIYGKDTKSYRWKFSTNLKGNQRVWRDATRPNALFLSTAVQLNNTQLLPVFDWFKKRLVVIAGSTKFNVGLTVKLLDQPKGKDVLLPFLHAADLGIAGVEIKREALLPGMTVSGSPIVLADSGTQPSILHVT